MVSPYSCGICLFPLPQDIGMLTRRLRNTANYLETLKLDTSQMQASFLSPSLSLSLSFWHAKHRGEKLSCRSVCEFLLSLGGAFVKVQMSQLHFPRSQIEPSQLARLFNLSLASHSLISSRSTTTTTWSTIHIGLITHVLARGLNDRISFNGSNEPSSSRIEEES